MYGKRTVRQSLPALTLPRATCRRIEPADKGKLPTNQVSSNGRRCYYCVRFWFACCDKNKDGWTPLRPHGRVELVAFATQPQIRPDGIQITYHLFSLKTSHNWPAEWRAARTSLPFPPACYGFLFNSAKTVS